MMHLFNPDKLKQQLGEWTQPGCYWVAFSGGADSTALLHAMARISSDLGRQVRAIHINHGLHPHADDWQAHCERHCENLAIELVQKKVVVEVGSRQSPEAQARTARYSAMLSTVEDNDMLLTAHHADDQAETIILNLMRGAGVDGLAAMQPVRRAGNAWLGRPLLNCRRLQLRRFLAENKIQFVDDPSNDDRSIRRNFVRHEILPRLEQMWPASTEQLNKSAAHVRSASQILKSMASADLRVCQGAYSYEIILDRLREFDGDRKALIIRQWAREHDLHTPDQRQMSELLKQLESAREDNALCLEWPGAEVHHYRSSLYIMPALPECPDNWYMDWNGQDAITLPAANGELSLLGTNSSSFADMPLQVHARGGNEKLLPVGQAHHKSLKQLFQAAGIPPWLRSRIPLLSSDGECLAVGDLWLDQAFAKLLGETGLDLQWQPGLQQWSDRREHILAAE